MKKILLTLFVFFFFAGPLLASQGEILGDSLNFETNNQFSVTSGSIVADTSIFSKSAVTFQENRKEFSDTLPFIDTRPAELAKPSVSIDSYHGVFSDTSVSIALKKGVFSQLSTSLISETKK